MSARTPDFRMPRSLRRGLAASAVLALPLAGGLLAPATAFADDTRTLIDFTQDEVSYGTSFVSVDAPGVTFTAVGGGSVMVDDWGNQSHGMGIGAELDLQMDFAEPVSGVELSFGNDDPYRGFAGDVVMTLFMDGEKVGEKRMATNADDDMNQSIAQSGGPTFDRATVEYVNTDGSSADLLMIVDDIYVGEAVQAEPQPEPQDPGACTITGTAGADVLVGTDGADVICGLGGDDVIKGLGGNDTIRGGDGDDTLVGGRGDDTVLGDAGRDTMRGGVGHDVAKGGSQLDLASSFEVVISAKVVRG